LAASLPPVPQAILQDKQDSTKLRLLYANKTPDDILLRDQLEEMAEDSKGQFQVGHNGVGSCLAGFCAGLSASEASFDYLVHLVWRVPLSGESIHCDTPPPPIMGWLRCREALDGDRLQELG